MMGAKLVGPLSTAVLTTSLYRSSTCTVRYSHRSAVGCNLVEVPTGDLLPRKVPHPLVPRLGVSEPVRPNLYTMHTKYI